MKLKWYWRLFYGCAGAFWIAAQVVASSIAGALRIAYHPGSPAPGFGLLDASGAVLAVYLMLVAALGRWRLWGSDK